MATTYEPIATTTLSSPAASITFSSIPSSYTDLRVILNVTGVSSTGLNTWLRFNSDAGTNYSFTQLYGNGTSVAASSAASRTQLEFNLAGPFSSTPSLYTFDIFSYASSSIRKTLLITASEDNNGSGATMRRVGLWNSTSAITTILISGDAPTYNAGTIATLYGIKSA